MLQFTSHEFSGVLTTFYRLVSSLLVCSSAQQYDFFWARCTNITISVGCLGGGVNRQAISLFTFVLLSQLLRQVCEARARALGRRLQLESQVTVTLLLMAANECAGVGTIKVESSDQSKHYCVLSCESYCYIAEIRSGCTLCR